MLNPEVLVYETLQQQGSGTPPRQKTPWGSWKQLGKNSILER